ncbi:MAG TPA: T9SS type A sorting domain-containing protein [Bacteroidales bacterium]|nr:T9SS type A sorting domain-containing protein [Bacteroidales bacterium]
MSKLFTITVLVLLIAINAYCIAPPNNQSPGNGSLDQAVALTLDWSAVTGNYGYLYEIDTSPDFNSSLLISDATPINSSQVYVSNLYFNTTYYWRTATLDEFTSSEWSETWSFTTSSGIENTSPSNLSVNQDVGLTLDWSSITGNTGYLYELDTLPDFSSPQLLSEATGANQSQTYVDNLFFTTTYYWRAAAINGVDTSEWTNVWSFTTSLTVANISPSNLAVNQDVGLTLDWSSITGNTGYLYELDTLPDFSSPILVSGTTVVNQSQSYVDGLFFNTQYYWRAAAINPVDTSEWSSTWSFSTSESVNNYSPSNGATNQNIALNLDWSTMTGNTGYFYNLDTVSEFNSPISEYGSSSINQSQISVSDLYYGTQYYWRAAAKNQTDTSEWSATWTFTTENQVTHYTPYNGQTNVSINPFIDWGNITGSSEYLLAIDTSFNFNSDLYEEFSGSMSQSSITGLLYGTTYYWRVAAYHSLDTSNWSEPWSFTTDYELTEAPMLESPTDLSTDLSYENVQLVWNSSTGASEYQYQVSTNADFTAIIKSANTSLVAGNINNLYPQTTYYWRVRGANNNGYSPWSEFWSFTTESADLAPPTLVSPTNNATGIDFDEVILNWNSVFGASQYIYEICTDPSFETGVTSNEVNNTFAEIYGLSDNTQYYWRVKASDGVVESDWSEIWNFTTQLVSLPPPTLIYPANNATDLDFNSITFEWAQVNGAEEYIFELATDGLFNDIVGTNTENGLTYLQEDLNPETEYFWRVKAKSGQIESDWSEIWSFVTLSDIEQFTLTINISGEGIVLVDGTEYSAPLSIDENTVLSLEAVPNSNSQFIAWANDLSSQDNPINLLMDSNKNITAEFIAVGNEQTINNTYNYLIYPNPANDFVFIEANSVNNISIYMLNGQKIMETNMFNKLIKIDLSEFSKGIYFIKLETESSIYFEKLIID